MAAKPLMALPFTRFSKSFTFLCPFNHKNFPVLTQACCILGWQPCEAGAFPPLDLCVWSCFLLISVQKSSSQNCFLNYQ